MFLGKFFSVGPGDGVKFREIKMEDMPDACSHRSRACQWCAVYLSGRIVVRKIKNNIFLTAYPGRIHINTLERECHTIEGVETLGQIV